MPTVEVVEVVEVEVVLEEISVLSWTKVSSDVALQESINKNKKMVLFCTITILTKVKIV